MFLAIRELRRARLRFGLLTGAVALLVFLILFQQALLDGLITKFIGALRNQSAEVLVYGSDARKNLEGSRVTDAQVAAVGKVAGVRVAERLGEGTFTVRVPGKADLQDAVLFGYRLDGPGAPTTLTEGRFPVRAGEAVASRADRSEGFGIGARITVEPGGQVVRVVGLARNLNYSVAPTLFVSWDTFAAARRAANPDASVVQASAVAVHVDAGADASAVAARISAAVPGVEALTRDDAVASSPGVKSVRQSFSVVLGLFYVVVPLVIGLFFLIVTFQKAGALTLLRAIGWPARKIASAILLQVVVVVVAGTAVAALLLSFAAKGTRSIEIRVTPGAVGGTGTVVLVLCVLAALAAVRRVAAIDPMSATTGQTGQGAGVAA